MSRLVRIWPTLRDMLIVICALGWGTWVLVIRTEPPSASTLTFLTGIFASPLVLRAEEARHRRRAGDDR